MSSNHATLTAQCIVLTLRGNPVFRYENDVLQNPGSVALDYEGNIYICDGSLNSIHIVSAEGFVITTIKEGCPNVPLAIEYDKDNNKFAVTAYRVWVRR